MQIGLMTLPGDVDRELFSDDDNHLSPLINPPGANDIINDEINFNVKTVPVDLSLNTKIFRTYHIKIVDCFGTNLTDDYVLTNDEGRNFIFPINGEFVINEFEGHSFLIGKAGAQLSNSRRNIFGQSENIIIRDYSKCLWIGAALLIFLLWRTKK